MSMAELIKILNCSCQSGGHYLDYSDNAIATLAAIVATAKLGAKGKNEERLQIVGKITRQYIAAGKEFDETLLMAMSRFATGGVPAGLDPKSLIKLFVELKKSKPATMSAMRAIRASKETQYRVKASDLVLQNNVDDDLEGALEDSRLSEAAGGSTSEKHTSAYDRKSSSEEIADSEYIEAIRKKMEEVEAAKDMDERKREKEEKAARDKEIALQKEIKTRERRLGYG